MNFPAEPEDGHSGPSIEPGTVVFAKGESIGQLVSAQPGSCVVASDPTTIFNLAPYPGAPAGALAGSAVSRWPERPG